MARKDSARDIEAICQRLADAMGYTLVEAGIEKEGAGRYLRAYIDKPGGVTLDDCEAYHRAAQPQLEHIEYDFLEISSPGLDRPLKTQRDFDRHVGEEITIKLFRAIGKRKEFQGRLIGLEGEEIVLEAQEGSMRFARREVAMARPVVSLEELAALEALEGVDDPAEPDAPRPPQAGNRSNRSGTI